MINPVNNNSRTEYQQPQTRRVDSSTGSSEHFSLRSALGSEDGADGVIYEPSSDELPGKATASPKKEPDTFERKLDEEIVKRQKGKEETPDEFTATFYRLWGHVEKFFKGLWANIKNIFGNLWDSKPIGEGLESMTIKREGSEGNPGTKEASSGSAKNAASGDAAISSVSDSISSLEKSRDESIRAALKDGDKDKFRSLISEGGKRAPAHSSTLLTTYNSKGRIREVSPSDANKILHGDRGARRM